MSAILLAKLLVTLACCLITGAPIFADLNKTHATNPTWTPHARFHVVWQVASYGLLGIIILFLVWGPGAMLTERLFLSCALLFAIIIGFFLTALSIRRFSGMFYDQNGYPPLGRARIAGKEIEFDLNATGFSVFSVVLVIATIATWMAS